MKIIKRNNTFVYEETGEIISPRFENYTCPEDYEETGVKSCEPMTAKEYLNEEELEKMLTSDQYYVEEKFDGTRGILQFFHTKDDGGYARVFSRRISKKTNFYCENSDLVPQLKDLNVPDLKGTVIDGEMFIPNRPFKDVASTLNCNWDKAIERQIELGYVVFHAFDIIYYKGIRVTSLPLHKRKRYLEKVIKKVNSPYIKLVTYGDVTMPVNMDRNTKSVIQQKNDLEKFKETYPHLFAEIGKHPLVELMSGVQIDLSKRAYYEFIVANGGEGVILKDKTAQYYHKRGREYTKWKKFLTRECVIMGFSLPTKEYEGKAPETWEYWWSPYGGMVINPKKPIPKSYEPVSKFYALNWVGNIKFGVIATPEEITAWQRRNKETPYVETINGELVMQVGECGGFDEAMREEFTKNKPMYKGQVVEIKANELFLDTGKMRHPRYLRLRTDKSMEECTWKNHIDC